MTSPSTQHTFYVSGTHCAACKHLIEDTLRDEVDITEATVSLSDETLVVTTSRQDEPAALAKRLTDRIHAHGYSVHVTRPEKKSSSNDWIYAIPITLLAVAGFILLERSGLVSFIGTSEITLGTAFLIGLVASVSTCLAVVGGLVLSVSATYAHAGMGWRPQVLFHVGRFAAFFLLGGLLGVMGDLLQIGYVGSAILSVLVGVVMIVLGIHLLDITKKVRSFTLPAHISARLTQAAKVAGPLTPVLIGAITFFLPCGFTQSMQIVALASGTFIEAASIMTVFALGTFPVLALLSFGAYDLARSTYKGIFFKSAGLLVILFALFTLHNAFVTFGIISPMIRF